MEILQGLYPDPKPPTTGGAILGTLGEATADILQAPQALGLEIPGVSDFAGDLRAGARAVYDPLTRGQGSFLGEDVPAAIAGSTPQMAAGAFGKALGGAKAAMMASGLVGGAQNATQTYLDVLSATGSEEKALQGWLGGFGLGAIEAAGIGGAASQLDKKTGGSLKKLILGFGMKVAGETAQEAVQTDLQTRLYEALTDEDIDYWAQQAQSAKVAPAVAAAFETMFGVPLSAARRLRKIRPLDTPGTSQGQALDAEAPQPKAGSIRDVAAQLDAQEQIAEQPAEETPAGEPTGVVAPPPKAQAETTAQGATPPASTPDVEREISEVQEEMRGIGEETAEAALAPKLKRRADYDPLTGALRREKGIEAAGQAVREARREGKLAGLLFADYDDFKSVNTARGYTEGDRLLAIGSEAMAKDLRQGDRALVRWGGDEFAVPLKVADEAGAEVVRARLEKVGNEAVQKAGFGEAGGKKIGISIGWEPILDTDDVSTEEGMKAVLKRAEAKMKARKAERKGGQTAQPVEPGATGMAPTETQAQPAPEPQKTTGVKNATVARELEEMGLPPVEKGEKKSDVETHARAKQVFEKNPEAGADLVTELQTSDRAVSDDDVALLTFEANKRIKAREKAEADFNEDPSEANQAKIKKAQEAYSELADVVDKAGTKTARALRIRRMMVARDYSLAAMERSVRVAKGGKALDAQETRKIAELHKEIAAAEKKYSEHVAASKLREIELEAKLELEKAKRFAARGERRGSTREKRKRSIAESKKRIDELVRKLAGGQRAAAGLDPEKVKLTLQLASEHIRLGYNQFSVWADEMVQRIGEHIRPYLRAAWDAAEAEKKRADFDDPAPLSEEQRWDNDFEDAKILAFTGEAVPGISERAKIWAGMLERGSAPPKRPTKERFSELRRTRHEEAIAASREKIDELVRDLSIQAGRARSGLDVDTLATTTRLAAEYIKIGYHKFSVWADEVVSLVGEHIRPYLRPAWDEASKAKDEELLERYKARKRTELEGMEEREAAGDFEKRTPRKTPIEKDKEAIRLKSEVEKKKRQFESLRERKRWQGMKKKEKALAIAREVIVDLPKALKSAYDVSAPFRQGLFFSLGHPIKTTANVGRMLKALVSERYARETDTRLRNDEFRPLASTLEVAGLELTDMDGPLSKREEALKSRISDKIPGIKASNRAFTTFLNLQRAEMADAMVKALPKDATMEQIRAIASFVNVATGRGDPGRMAKHMETVGLFLWSPRLLLSRLQLGTGKGVLYGGVKGTRKAIAKEYARSIMGLAAFYSAVGIAKEALGLDDDELHVEKDPRSSDFGKIRMGNTRLDPLGGFAQIATLVGRQWTGQTKDDDTGKIKELGEDPITGSRLTVLMRFARNKLTPTLGTASELLDEKMRDNFEKPTVKGTLKSAFAPLSLAEIGKVIEDQGVPKGTALMMVSLFGAGLQVYEPKKTKKKQR